MVLEMTVSTSFILSLGCMWACVWSEQNLPGLKDPPASCVHLGTGWEL